MNVRRMIPLFICASVLAATVLLSALSKPAARESAASAVTRTDNSATADEPPEKVREMRGVWVTYMDLSMENEPNRSEGAFREKFAHIAKVCADSGFNTLIVQVRPFCDALYPSGYFPWSHILSGQQGVSPGYDPLADICDICRTFGLDIHAWVNPYRVSVSQTPRELSDGNPFVTHPEMCIETESGVILDPSSADARELIENGVRELIENYDIDGIQFDDYFYPTDIGELDKEQYEAFLDTSATGKPDWHRWREINVNILIAEVAMLVQNSGKDVVFGISPQGNLANNDALCADVTSWCCAMGYADYVCPQIYFSPDNPKLGFAEALSDWTSLDRARSVKLYAGLAGYKAGTDADEGTWLDREDILKEEYLLLKEKGLDGFMLYSFPSLESEEAGAEIRNLLSVLE